MIQAIEDNLKKGIKLLNFISEQQYKNTTIAPYKASIGSHMRHVMDVFDCVFKGLESGEIDLDSRNRSFEIEQDILLGKAYAKTILFKMNRLSRHDMNRYVFVTDTLGSRKIRTQYTLASILMQAHSHAIHHYAIIGYILHQLGIELPDAVFGLNPTTPKKGLFHS
jgi:uncharacterized damage-inducible protein DinB